MNKNYLIVCFSYPNDPNKLCYAYINKSKTHRGGSFNDLTTLLSMKNSSYTNICNIPTYNKSIHNVPPFNVHWIFSIEEIQTNYPELLI